LSLGCLAIFKDKNFQSLRTSNISSLFQKKGPLWRGGFDADPWINHFIRPHTKDRLRERPSMWEKNKKFFSKKWKMRM
jgi:hypothetical protein